jgi:hypothetical protein
MPNILVDPRSVAAPAEISDKKYNYDYPYGLDLRPGSELHNKIKAEVLNRARESRNMMEKRFDSWNEIDETLTVYVKLSSEEKKIRDKDAKTPSTKRPVTIVFPYTYAVLETILTYLLLAFAQDPIFRYEGVSPEDTIGAILLEKIVDVHCNKSKVALNLHTMNRDAVAYGLGASAPMWRERWGQKVRRVASENIFGEPYSRETEETLLFEGNALENIDPYLFLPDPNVPIQKIQEGEFVGWVDIDNYTGLLSEEYSDPEVFNVRYLKHLLGRKSIFADKQSKRQEFAGGHYDPLSQISKRVDTVNMYITLIPKEWKIDNEEKPEKWLFSLASDEIVIRAKPLGLNHNLYPIVVTAPEFDGYSPTPISRVEVLKGLQGVLDWLFNSHIANVRKAINDMLVVDPYLVNMKDLRDPEAGKLIRMRRPAWGRGVKDAVIQLAVTDVTRGNVEDTAIITQWMDRIGGADQSMQGSLRQGGPERLTKGEFQGTRSGAINRLERIARIIGLQAMQDIGYMFAAHTQQLMSQETYVKTTGEWQQRLVEEFAANIQDNRMKVTPYDILVDYDVLVRDGTVPGGNFSEAWVQVWGILADHPELQREFDVFRIFSYIARSLGAKNVHEFKRIEIAQPEQVQEQARQGNLIPFAEMMG